MHGNMTAPHHFYASNKKVVLFYSQKKFCLKEVTTKYPIYKISLGVKANKKIIQNFMLHKF